MANHLKAAAQAKKNSKYWQKRLRDPIYKAYNENEKATKAWLKFYEDAKKDIDAELMDVYKRIGKDDPKISDFYRSNHLEKIEKQIEKSLVSIGNKEDTYLKGKIKDGVKLGSKTVSDALQTSMLNKRAIDQLIKQPWQDGDFSSRVWDNKAQLIASMKSELTAGIVKGDGIYKVADRLDKRLDVGKSQTQRLARTEYMHALNAGQLETYQENRYDKLEWVASEDGKGCDICHLRNGKQYKIDDVPVLPAHPNCRCTMIPIITDEMIEEQAKALKEAQEQETEPKLETPQEVEERVSFLEQEMRKLEDEDWGDLTEEQAEELFDQYDTEWRSLKDKLDEMMYNNSENKHYFTTDEGHPLDFFKANSNYNEWLESLTEDQKDIVFGYTATEYGSLNEILRYGEEAYLNNTLYKGTPMEYKQKMINRSRELQNILDNFETKQGFTTYRSIGGNFDLDTIKDIEVFDDGFMSTTLSYENTENFADTDNKVVFTIHVNEGSKVGAYVQELSNYGGEHEFLIKPKTQFKVLGTRKEKTRYGVNQFIELEAIG
ncbi:minor capsid protein [Tetragenococcus halophilus]|uniref:minor capsid protein n=1 Tax=Tetragenococcus halophilus TaxID=51669 RepID=UPI00209B95EF|nr:minor capsid protein [Tetragenococcus halophilus]MCO8291274.1 minor capsid protein [Tetragenococcus halophilus]